MPAVGQLKGEHQLQPVVLWVLRHSVAGDLRGFVVFMRIAIGVHFGVVSVLLEIAAELGYFLVGGDGVIKLALLAIQNGKPVEEQGTVVLLLIGVLAVGMFGAGGKLLEDGNRSL